MQLTVDRPSNTETTALGAAYLAALHTGVYSSLDSISDNWKSAQSFECSMSQEVREQLLNKWRKAVKLVAAFAER